MKRFVWLALSATFVAACGGNLLLSPKDLGRIEAAKDDPLSDARELGRLRLGFREAPARGDTINVAVHSPVEAPRPASAADRCVGAWLGALTRELKAEDLPSGLEPEALTRAGDRVILTAAQTWHGMRVLERGLVIECAPSETRVQGALLVAVKADVVGAQQGGIDQATASETARSAVERRFPGLAGEHTSAAEAVRMLVPAERAGKPEARPAWLVVVDTRRQGRPIVFVDALDGSVLRIEDTLRQEAAR